MHNDRSAGWPGITRTQFSTLTNLVLTLSTGLMAYVSQNTSSRDILFRLAIVGLALSIAAGLLCAWTRLQDFRLTARIARGEVALRAKAAALGRWSWRLLTTQLILFGLGAITVGIRIF